MWVDGELAEEFSGGGVDDSDLEEATEITGVTPHSFRRTVATFVDHAGGSELAAELLGHTSSEITRAHYIEPNEQVNPITAKIPRGLARPRNRDG